ncbi:hypothetical protein F4825DRAFT_145347 [Nemania diffusa]|nr:hypothetical protein F4825DRAFT_145347 [Nemania diffusa]
MPRRVVTEQGLTDQVMTILGLPRLQDVPGASRKKRGRGEDNDGDNDDDNDDDDSGYYDLLGFPKPGVERRAASKFRRIWHQEDRQHLSELKGKGWSNQRIAEELQRSQGAVEQQWRKQS